MQGRARRIGGRYWGIAVVLGAVLVMPLTGASAAAEEARFLFGAQRDGDGQAPAPIGSYARGCLSGGEQLAESGPGWQTVRLSRNRNWGHPAMIAYIERLAEQAQAIGWSNIYVADISQPRGGPMTSGHQSHQIGLDADIWLRRPAERALSLKEREGLKTYSVVAANKRNLNANWTPAHHALIRLAASDPAVARIFVNPAIKKGLCEGEPANADRRWLRKVRAWFGHDAHFHIRLACPEGAKACIDQAPPPPGDGCGAELASWWQPPDPNAKPAKRTGPPRGRYLKLSQMPLACWPLVR